jgi:hypothetical protein
MKPLRIALAVIFMAPALASAQLSPNGVKTLAPEEAIAHGHLKSRHPRR